ncbi:MAG: TonB-dependent receptor [Caulobacter sp.]
MVAVVSTVVLAALVTAGSSAAPDPAPAAAPPAAETPRPDDTAVAEVVVVAERPAVVKQIDRQVYDVRNDPEAQTASVMDVLGKVPSVTTTPAGAVLLLGQSGVTILIDGKPGNIRGLRGADIERIEVMTNPSAQYGPQGAAGIINIITRKDRRQGLTGAVTAGVDSQGGYWASAGPNWVIGRWTLGGSLSLASQNSDSELEVRRRERDGLGGEVNVIEASRYRSDSENYSGGLKLAFRRNDQQRFYVNVQAFQASGDNRGRTRATADDASFASYAELTDRPFRFEGLDIDAGYDWTGPTEGESFSLSFTANPVTLRTVDNIEDRFDDPALPARRFREASDFDNLDLELKADYKRPLDGSRILALGADWTRADQTEGNVFENLAGPDPVRDLDQSIHGIRDVWSSYVTYQFPLAPWTVMPGLRVESETFDVRSMGAIGSSRDLFWYPSLHVTRDLGEALKLSLSYSRRIDRPDLGRLDPAIRYSGANEARRGNPDLDPVTADAYEARLDYAKGNFGAGLTLYSRESSGTWSSFSTLTPDGVRLTTTINAGESANRGAELALRGKVASKWQYVVTTNLFWREQQVLVGGVPRADSRFSYTGNAQFRWKAAPANPDTGDQVQLSLRYQGPTASYQGSWDGFFRADLTLRRPFTKRVTGVLIISDLLDSSESHSQLNTTDYDEETTSRGSGPTARFSLTYRLGGPD